MPMQRIRAVVMLNTLLVLALGLLASRPDPVAANPAGGPDQALAIIVNQSNPVDNCSFEELRKIFLGEKSHWPNGRRITLVMSDPSLPERKVVLREIYGMSEKDLNNHFIQGVFTGNILSAPKTLSTPGEVRKFVFNVPGAIGYLRDGEADSSVKVLRIDGRLPEDKEYRLRLQPRGGKP
jgi:ABC-type phosphate transport system substrate-binding protein